MVRGVRGATTVEANDAAEIVTATKEVLDEMIKMNDLKPEDVAQMIITVTHDLDATFPARAVRLIDGWRYVPVMCALEIPVPHSLPKCIRVMATVNTNRSQLDIQHIYLRNAIHLRPDLQTTNEQENE